jgi:predicted ribosomally synthesized peptide with SipW-like signal peptide
MSKRTAIAVVAASFVSGALLTAGVGHTFAAWSDYAVVHAEAKAGTWGPDISIPAECAHMNFDKVVVLTDGPDTYTPDNGALRELIFGLGGNDIIHGGNQDDCLVGGDGDDQLFGENGKDVLLGGNGNDNPVDGGNGKDELYGGPGDDTIDGSNGPDVIDGGSGDDSCNGGHAPDSITDCESTP